MYDGVPRTRHIVTNIVIDLNDDQITAQCRSYVQVLHQAPGGVLGPVAAGTYIDRVYLTNGSWKFAERRMLLELIGDMSTHLLQNPFA
jgi:3-phenylpropionate/cinnamic acid dioxygenase small subunit